MGVFEANGQTSQLKISAQRYVNGKDTAREGNGSARLQACRVDGYTLGSPCTKHWDLSKPPGATMWHMRTTSVRELHIHTSKLVREAAEGGVIVIERRGEPVAELRPVTVPPRIAAAKKARIFTSMRRIWARMPRVSDSAKIIENDRSR